MIGCKSELKAGTGFTVIRSKMEFAYKNIAAHFSTKVTCTPSECTLLDS